MWNENDGFSRILESTTVPLIQIDISSIAEGTTFSLNTENCKVTRIDSDKVLPYAGGAGSYNLQALTMQVKLNDYRDVANAFTDITYGSAVQKPLSFALSNEIRAIRQNDNVILLLQGARNCVE